MIFLYRIFACLLFRQISTIFKFARIGMCEEKNRLFGLVAICLISLFSRRKSVSGKFSPFFQICLNRNVRGKTDCKDWLLFVWFPTYRNKSQFQANFHHFFKSARIRMREEKQIVRSSWYCSLCCIVSVVRPLRAARQCLFWWFFVVLPPGHLLEVFQLFWKASGGFLLVWARPRGGAWGTVQMVVFVSGPFLETIAPYESSTRKSLLSL